MKLAFVLFKYFPFGGLQRDFLRIAKVCQTRGHDIEVYTLSWEGEVPEGLEPTVVPIRALTNTRRNHLFSDWLNRRFSSHPVDRIIGFERLPGLDIYYAATTCYAGQLGTTRPWSYSLNARVRCRLGFERAVFSPNAPTQILMISKQQQAIFVRHYGTQPSRFHMLPPGIARDRKAPPDAEQIRDGLRREFEIGRDDYVLLMVGSGFKTKGLDRALLGLRSLPEDMRKRAHFFAIGQDNPKQFMKYAARLGLTQQVRILPGRSDVLRFFLGSDLLIHPAYNENTGTVLLEAVIAGLPVLVTDVCGYAHYIDEVPCGVVLPSPFSQAALNQQLITMLTDHTQRAAWKQSGLIFAEHANIYSMPEHAATLIEQLPVQR